MRIRQSTQTENSWQSTSTPVTSPFQSRPFPTQEQTEESPSEQQEIPNLQAQPKTTGSFGHNFANISVYPPGTPQSDLPIFAKTIPVVSEKTEGQIQRFGDPEGSSLLTEAQVQQAKAWYAANRKQYTPKIIEQIQKEVGTKPDRAIGKTTIQAIAKWQKDNPPLTVDGKAGPRTLPAMFPSGLAELAAIEDFVGKAKQVEAYWTDLKTPNKRAKTLLQLVNDTLGAADVPACNSSLEDLGSNLGVFDLEKWVIILDEKVVSQETLTEQEAADVAETVYHEARHAEQSYRIAQRLAGMGKSAKAIATEMKIAAGIASKAFDNPLKAGSMDALIAEGWHESRHGAKAAETEQIMLALYTTRAAFRNANTDFNKAEEAYYIAEVHYRTSAGDPRRMDDAQKRMDDAQKKMDDAQKKMDEAEKQYKAVYEKYENLPEETDSRRVGGEFKKAYLKE